MIRPCRRRMTGLRRIALSQAPCVRSAPFSPADAFMARDQIDMTPIEMRDELVAWLEAGCKPQGQFRVGTEHEKFAFTTGEHRPVPYAGQIGRASCRER